MEETTQQPEQPEPVQKVRKKVIPPALPPAVQVQLKEDIRNYFATMTRGQIVRLLAPKFSVTERTIYNYINKVVREDVKDISRENVLNEILASRSFRKRCLLSNYSRLESKERERGKLEDDGLSEHYDAQILKLNILKQLVEEDKWVVEILKQFKLIEKPDENELDIKPGDNILAKLEERFKARLKRRSQESQ